MALPGGKADPSTYVPEFMLFAAGVKPAEIDPVDQRNSIHMSKLCRDSRDFEAGTDEDMTPGSEPGIENHLE